jgi:hypothetical protein
MVQKANKQMAPASPRNVRVQSGHICQAVSSLALYDIKFRANNAPKAYMRMVSKSIVILLLRLFVCLDGRMSKKVCDHTYVDICKFVMRTRI